MSTPPSGSPLSLLAVLAGYYNRRYTLISFHFPPTISELEASHYIQPVINTADDWLKYAPNNWIVWSAKTPKEWYDKFQPIEQLKQCSIFIVGLNLSPDNRAGQFPQWVWDWLQKPRTEPGLASILVPRK